MPGIVGIITKKPRELIEPELRLMVSAIRHKLSYGTDIWIDERSGVYCGWATRAGSFGNDMFFCGQTSNSVLVFSGEEFSKSPESFEKRGHGSHQSGASYLIDLFENDPRFPYSLNGRFQGLAVDKDRKTSLLFNDRYGMHRLYYHDGGDAFYFAAEAKAILAVHPELRVIEPRSLGELISCGCVMENRTLFAGIEVLPPASSWTFIAGVLQKKALYFEPSDWESQEVEEPEQYYQQVKEVFARKLPRYFEGHGRVGMSLTGGLDTRMIMAWHRAERHSLPCYSFGGMFRDCQDVRIARKIAETCGQSHQVIPVEKEFLGRFAHFAEQTVYLTDGCADVSHSPDLYVNELAAQIAPVRMTGNYGGEVLRRVRAFKASLSEAALWDREAMTQVYRARDTYNGLLEIHPLSFSVFRQAPWHHYGLLALEQTQLTLRSPYLDNELVKTIFRAPRSALMSNETSLRLVRDGNPTLASIRTDRGLGGSEGVGAQFVRAYQEFTFKAEYAYDYGMPQWVSHTDHILAPLRLERLFLGRHKFYHFRVWYRDAVSDYVREILLDSRTLSRPYLHRKRVEQIVRGHLTGGANYTTAIHKLLTIELIHRLFIDRK